MTSFHYIGSGHVYYEGVPMRDLEEDDWDALTPEQQATVAASSLYVSADVAEQTARAEARAVRTADRREAAAARAEAKAGPPPDTFTFDAPETPAK